jgi:hypothetical protein
MTCDEAVRMTGNRSLRRFLTTAGMVPLVVAGAFVLAAPAGAQTICPVAPIASGLQSPQSIVQSEQGNLLVAESGPRPPNSGRISIVGLAGDRRTLVDGLPSGIGDSGDPSGPAGLFLRGRTLFALIGIGDAILNGSVPGTFTANPHPSSHLFSSVLAIQFSAHVEQTTDGFTLSLADRRTLARRGQVTLSNGDRDRITIELVANFPDYTREPLASAPLNVRGSNPFAVVAVGNDLYVTDGAQNSVWHVDISTGAFSTLATFPATMPNPLPVGPPFVEAVPTGIASAQGQLFVTLFSGVPFAPGTSSVVQIDPSSGATSSFISDLTTAIGILPLKPRRGGDFLVLQTSSGPEPFFAGPGLLFRVNPWGVTQAVIADCLQAPTSMVLDTKTRTLYVTGLTGDIVSIALAREGL